MADCGSCVCSGVWGSSLAPPNWKSGMSIDSNGRGRAISAVSTQTSYVRVS